MGTISPTRLCLPGAQKERRNLACGTGAGDDRGHLWPGPLRLRSILARDTGVSRPLIAELGYIGAGSYAGYCLAIVVALVFTSRTGPRFMAVAAGAAAVVGMAVVACAPAAWVLAVGILDAGSSSGLASPPMAEAVVTSIRERLQDRANALINPGKIDKLILQHTATPRNRHRRIVAPKDARTCHWTCCRTVAVARPDTNLIPLGTQYGATRSNPENRNRLRYAGFATSCKPLQHLTDHS
jgi:hypothetical protein